MADRKVEFSAWRISSGGSFFETRMPTPMPDAKHAVAMRSVFLTVAIILALAHAKGRGIVAAIAISKQTRSQIAGPLLTSYHQRK